MELFPSPAIEKVKFDNGGWYKSNESFPDIYCGTNNNSVSIAPCHGKIYFRNSRLYSSFLKFKVAISNGLIFSKLRDRLNQFNSMEMNDKRRADVQRMKRFEKKVVI